MLQTGEILFQGIKHRSPSAAGKAAIQIFRPEATNPAGWDFWATKNPDGSFKHLSQWREECIKSLD